MKTADKITVTDGRLKKALKNQISPMLMPDVNKQITKAFNDSKFQVGIMTKFYPYLDKCEVKLRNGKLVLCKILHRYAGEMIDFYTPTGEKSFCTSLKEPCIIPLEELQCLILDVNDDSNEQIFVGYINLQDFVGLDPASPGDFKILSHGVSNQYWIRFGPNGLDLRSKKLPTNNVGEFDSNMINVDYATKKDIKELQDEIDNLEPSGGDLKDYIKKEDLIDNTKCDVDLNLNFGLKGLDDTITIDMGIVDYVVEKIINTNGS